MDSQDIYLLLRKSHIFVGFVGLVAFWIPVAVKKGGRLHVLAGRVFEWCGYYVAGTAIFACARYLLIPHHFAFVSRPDASAEELLRIEGAQFLLTLLLFLAWAFLFQLRNGVRVVRTRKLTADKYRNWELTFWLYSHLLIGIALSVYGAYRLATGGGPQHWASVIVGLIPVFEFKGELHFYRNPRKPRCPGGTNT